MEFIVESLITIGRFKAGHMYHVTIWSNNLYHIKNDCALSIGLDLRDAIIRIDSQSEIGMMEAMARGVGYELQDLLNNPDWKFDYENGRCNKVTCNNVTKVNLNDPVNHPSHYTSGKIEVMDFIADQNLNFGRGNVVKYTARAGKKDPAKELEDLRKAAWYLNYEIKKLEGNEGRPTYNGDAATY